MRFPSLLREHGISYRQRWNCVGQPHCSRANCKPFCLLRHTEYLSIVELCVLGQLVGGAIQITVLLYCKCSLPFALYVGCVAQLVECACLNRRNFPAPRVLNRWTRNLQQSAIHYLFKTSDRLFRISAAVFGINSFNWSIFSASPCCKTTLYFSQNPGFVLVEFHHSLSGPVIPRLRLSMHRWSYCRSHELNTFLHLNTRTVTTNESGIWRVRERDSEFEIESS